MNIRRIKYEIYIFSKQKHSSLPIYLLGKRKY